MNQTDQICNMSGLNRDLKGLMSWYMIIFFSALHIYRNQCTWSLVHEKEVLKNGNSL